MKAKVIIVKTFIVLLVNASNGIIFNGMIII